MWTLGKEATDDIKFIWRADSLRVLSAQQVQRLYTYMPPQSAQTPLLLFFLKNSVKVAVPSLHYFNRSSVLSFPSTCIISTRPGPSFIPVKACLIVVMNGFRGTSPSRSCSSFNVRCRMEGDHESAESNRDVRRMEDIAEMVWDRWSGVTRSNMDLASSVDKSGSLKRYGACFGMSYMLVSRPPRSVIACLMFSTLVYRLCGNTVLISSCTRSARLCNPSGDDQACIR